MMDAPLSPKAEKIVKFVACVWIFVVTSCIISWVWYGQGFDVGRDAGYIEHCEQVYHDRIVELKQLGLKDETLCNPPSD